MQELLKQKENTEQFNQFDEKQKEQIKLGLEDNLDMSICINPEFNWKQMKEIRLGILDNVNILDYAKPDINWEQMREIRLLLKNTRYGSYSLSTKFQENISSRSHADINSYYPDLAKVISKDE